jgi:transcriptional regulator with XRE-family HTH domain
MSVHLSPERLRAARERNGLSRMRAAVGVARHERSIAAYEAGAANPSVQTLIRLAELYRCPIEDFLGGDDEVGA